MRRQRQTPFLPALGFLLEIQHGHTEIRVVVGVAISGTSTAVKVIQKIKPRRVLSAVEDKGRVHHAADLQALHAGSVLRVFSGFNFHADPVEVFD